MQNKLLPIQLICTLLCIGLAVAAFLVFKAKPNNVLDVQKLEINNSKTFDNNSYNTIVADTFISLVKKAYPTFATSTIQNKNLHISINGANALTQDFYNGNENILKYTLSDFGFAIKYLPSTKSIEADFTINNNGVNIPNDVLIRLVSKTFVAPNSTQIIKKK